MHSLSRARVHVLPWLLAVVAARCWAGCSAPGRRAPGAQWAVLRGGGLDLSEPGRGVPVPHNPRAGAGASASFSPGGRLLEEFRNLAAQRHAEGRRAGAPGEAEAVDAGKTEAAASHRSEAPGACASTGGPEQSLAHEGPWPGEAHDNVVRQLKTLSFEDAVLPLLRHSARKRGFTDPEALLRTFRENGGEGALDSAEKRLQRAASLQDDEGVQGDAGSARGDGGGWGESEQAGQATQPEGFPRVEAEYVDKDYNMSREGEVLFSERKVARPVRWIKEGQSCEYITDEDEDEEVAGGGMFATEFSLSGRQFDSAEGGDADCSSSGALDGGEEGPTAPTERDLRLKKWAADHKVQLGRRRVGRQGGEGERRAVEAGKGEGGDGGEGAEGGIGGGKGAGAELGRSGDGSVPEKLQVVCV